MRSEVTLAVSSESRWAAAMENDAAGTKAAKKVDTKADLWERQSVDRLVEQTVAQWEGKMELRWVE